MQTLCEHLFSAKVIYQSRAMNALINMVLITNDREITIHVYSKTADVNLYHVTKFSPYFPFTLYYFYTKRSSFIPVLTIWIFRDCFYLLIFYSEKFSTWVWRLPFAVNVNLNLSNLSWLFFAKRDFNFIGTALLGNARHQRKAETRICIYSRALAREARQRSTMDKKMK